MPLRWIANRLLFVLFTLFTVSGFAGSEITMEPSLEKENMHQDPHSFSNPEEVVVKDLTLDATVDFTKKQIAGKATLQIENKKGVRKLHLDSSSLRVDRVTLGEPEQATTFEIGKSVQYLGEPLIIDIQPDTKQVHIYYATSPKASALQWLEPAQTAGGKQPFLYTQSQTALARSWVPCQDTPGVRMTYRARMKVPSDLMAVMSAENPGAKNSTGVYEFKMPHPVPSYLLALAVGDIEFRSMGKRTGVYSEPPVVDKAAWEFAETEKMIETAEKLYGPYRWGRYDLIVLPPSFPWGGMENPMLTFATPTVITGDRSLVALVAHELAHSWSGNLVTNATWNDFWLNEGFTTYLDHRIMEVIYGKEFDDMLSVLSLQDLQKEIVQLGAQSPDTRLKTDLAGRDPEDSSTQIPYEKGQFFLRTIEAAVGRQRFDEFLKAYFDHFAFHSITTEDFLDYLRKNLIRGDYELEKKLQIEAWIYRPGIPSNIVTVHSDALARVDAQIKQWSDTTQVKQLQTTKWTTQEWMHFLRHLPPKLDADQLGQLDAVLHLSSSSNCEILHEWLLQVIARKYEPGYPAIEHLLTVSGRRKYVKSMMTQLAKTPGGLAIARKIYVKTRPTYHTVTRDIADRILQWKS